MYWLMVVHGSKGAAYRCITVIELPSCQKFYRLLNFPGFSVLSLADWSQAGLSMVKRLYIRGETGGF